jgi:hypothetical protein
VAPVVASPAPAVAALASPLVARTPVVSVAQVAAVPPRHELTPVLYEGTWVARGPDATPFLGSWIQVVAAAPRPRATASLFEPDTDPAPPVCDAADEAPEAPPVETACHPVTEALAAPSVEPAAPPVEPAAPPVEVVAAIVEAAAAPVEVVALIVEAVAPHAEVVATIVEAAAPSVEEIVPAEAPSAEAVVPAPEPAAEIVAASEPAMEVAAAAPPEPSPPPPARVEPVYAVYRPRKSDVSALVAGFGVSESRTLQELARDLKKMAGVALTPGPPDVSPRHE